MDKNTSESWLVLRQGDKFSVRYFYNPQMDPTLVASGAMKYWMDFFELNDAHSLNKLFKHNKDIYDMSSDPTDEIDDEWYEGKILFRSWPAKFQSKGDVGKLALYDEDVGASQNQLSWHDVVALVKNHGTIYVFDGRWEMILKPSRAYDECIKVDLEYWSFANAILSVFQHVNMEEGPSFDVLVDTIEELEWRDFPVSPSVDQLGLALFNFLNLPPSVQSFSDLEINDEMRRFVGLIPQVHALQSKASLQEHVGDDALVTRRPSKI